MTTDWCKAIAAGARGAALTALGFACAAQAQNTGSVNDYQLPPPPAAPAPSVQGPIDPENPVAPPRPQAPRPTATPAGEATAAPRIVLPTTAAPTEQREQPSADRRGQSAPAAPTQAAATPSPQATAPADVPPAPLPAEPTLAAPASPAPAALAPETEQQTSWWPFLLGGAVALLAVGALLWLRRKPAAIDAEELQPEPAPIEPIALEPLIQAAPAVPTPAAPTPAAPAAIAAAPAPPIPRPVFAGSPIAFRLEPQSLRLSLVYATLAYRLDLTNSDKVPLDALRISGGMISGHASLSVGEQLSFESDGLEAKHDVASLAPGETASLKGELRLPLNQIVPIRAGAAVLFAPLVRFLIDGTPKGQDAFSDNKAFTIGLPSGRVGGAMQPFRLDLGPQLFREVEQREIDLARWLPLDVARRAS